MSAYNPDAAASFEPGDGLKFTGKTQTNDVITLAETKVSRFIPATRWGYYYDEHDDVTLVGTLNSGVGTLLNGSARSFAIMNGIYGWVENAAAVLDPVITEATHPFAMINGISSGFALANKIDKTAGGENSPGIIKKASPMFKSRGLWAHILCQLMDIRTGTVRRWGCPKSKTATTSLVSCLQRTAI